MSQREHFRVITKRGCWADDDPTPKRDWANTEIIDAGRVINPDGTRNAGATCGMCGQGGLRWIHVMYHPVERLTKHVGCVCAATMADGYDAVENELRFKAKVRKEEREAERQREAAARQAESESGAAARKKEAERRKVEELKREAQREQRLIEERADIKEALEKHQRPDFMNTGWRPSAKGNLTRSDRERNRYGYTTPGGGARYYQGFVKISATGEWQRKAFRSEDEVRQWLFECYVWLETERRLAELKAKV